MATEFETDRQQNLTEIVGGIIQDAQQLARQQLNLFQVELKNDMQRSARAGLLLVAGVVVCLVGGIIAAQAIAYLLPTIWPNLPLWGGLAIVGGGLLLLGMIGACLGLQRFNAFRPPPTETVQGLKENLLWKTNK